MLLLAIVSSLSPTAKLLFTFVIDIQDKDDQILQEKKEEIKTIVGESEISKQYFECFLSTKKRWDIINDGRMAYSFYEDAFNEIKKYNLECMKKGVKIRLITEITKENLFYCKDALPYFSEMRHIDNVTSNSVVSDCCYLQAYEVFYKKCMPSQCIFGNVIPFVRQQQQFFDIMWEKATPAIKRIMETEKSIGSDYTETIQDPLAIMELYTNIIKSSTKEIMLIVPSPSICKLLIEETQLLNLLYRVADNRDAHIKILAPIDKSLQETIETNDDNANKKFDKQIQIRSVQMPFIQKMEHTSSPDLLLSSTNYVEMKSTMVLISDMKVSLVVQIKEDQSTSQKNKSRSLFNELIKSATYSNKETTVISYISLFERLWQQVELYKKVIESENAQNEFINIAAHELRNPIQPILGLAEIARDKSKDSEQKEILNVITRNAEKLKNLSDSILEVARAEKNILKLERVDIIQLILDSVQEYQKYVVGKKVSIEFENNLLPLPSSTITTTTGSYNNNYDINDKRYIINADKNRLNQVISNLIDNAIKFTDEGVIKIQANINKKGGGGDHIIKISIKDSGKGIDPSIMDKLFTKFATAASDKGTGLGLYLSKKIIEAHGGTICAYNNAGEKGATFSFSLPVRR